MEPGEAALRVLRQAEDPLHWTVIWDEALKRGYIDPFTQPEAREEMVRWLARAARAGEIEKTSKGTYRLPGPGGA